MKIKMKVFAVFLLLVVGVVIEVKGQPTGDLITVVDEVIDGDTFDTVEGFRLRLVDIDAPEICEPGYRESLNI